MACAADGRIRGGSRGLVVAAGGIAKGEAQAGGRAGDVGGGGGMGGRTEREWLL